jgi:hypothetical protein
MDIAAAKETVENIRRATERGLGRAQKDAQESTEFYGYLDSFQHLLDEIAVLKVYLED